MVLTLTNHVLSIFCFKCLEVNEEGDEEDKCTKETKLIEGVSETSHRNRFPVLLVVMTPSGEETRPAHLYLDIQSEKPNIRVCFVDTIEVTDTSSGDLILYADDIKGFG